MRLYARTVLDDCRLAIQDFRDAAPTPFWRVRWVGVVALLRAVGHVLQRVDAPSNPRIKVAVDSEFTALKQSRPHPLIFWEFIEGERNSVLKAYSFTIHLHAFAHPGVASYDLRAGHTGGTEPTPTTYEYFLRSGPFAPRDPLDVCQEALAFWDAHLKRIEARL